MSVIINGTGSISGLSNVGGIASAQSGSVIQTVSTVSVSNAIYATTTNSTLTSTGLSVSITPQFSTSKIVVTVSSNGGTGASGSCYYTIYRNATNLASGTSPGAICSIRNNTVGASPITPVVMTTLDSPATTSATTYTAYFFTNSGNTAYFGAPNTDLNSVLVSIIAQEIAV